MRNKENPLLDEFQIPGSGLSGFARFAELEPDGEPERETTEEEVNEIVDMEEANPTEEEDVLLPEEPEDLMDGEDLIEAKIAIEIENIEDTPTDTLLDALELIDQRRDPNAEPTIQMESERNKILDELAERGVEASKKLGQNVEVYDTGENVIDKYTVIIGDDVYTMSKNADSPAGVSMYAGNRNEVSISGDKLNEGEIPDGIKRQIEYIKKSASKKLGQGEIEDAPGIPSWDEVINFVKSKRPEDLFRLPEVHRRYYDEFKDDVLDDLPEEQWDDKEAINRELLGILKYHLRNDESIRWQFLNMPGIYEAIREEMGGGFYGNYASKTAQISEVESTFDAAQITKREAYQLGYDRGKDFAVHARAGQTVNEIARIEKEATDADFDFVINQINEADDEHGTLFIEFEKGVEAGIKQNINKKAQDINVGDGVKVFDDDGFWLGEVVETNVAGNAPGASSNYLRVKDSTSEIHLVPLELAQKWGAVRKKAQSNMERRARRCWELMDENERTAIRIGMSPSWTIEKDLGGKAPGEGFEKLEGDEHRQHAVALMNIAKDQGGMIASKAKKLAQIDEIEKIRDALLQAGYTPQQLHEECLRNGYKSVAKDIAEALGIEGDEIDQQAALVLAIKEIALSENKYPEQEQGESLEDRINNHEFESVQDTKPTPQDFVMQKEKPEAEEEKEKEKAEEIESQQGLEESPNGEEEFLEEENGPEAEDEENKKPEKKGINIPDETGPNTADPDNVIGGKPETVQDEETEMRKEKFENVKEKMDDHMEVEEEMEEDIEQEEKEVEDNKKASLVEWMDGSKVAQDEDAVKEIVSMLRGEGYNIIETTGRGAYIQMSFSVPVSPGGNYSILWFPEEKEYELWGDNKLLEGNGVPDITDIKRAIERT